MKKRGSVAALSSFILLAGVTSTVNALPVDQSTSSIAKKPVKIERKGSMTYEWYNGASPTKLPSEQEIAKKKARRGAAKTLTSVKASYDNTDPASTGCANDAITAKSVRVLRTSDKKVLGTIELRYSRKCKTAWSRMGVEKLSMIKEGEAFLYRKESDSFVYKGSAGVSPGTSNYTNQFNDDKTVSLSHGRIQLRDNQYYEAETEPY
ncbi:DUF2690 domain-containing protein [Thermoflavimicrobium daqui]|uniref:DUF2690 domain-containing protein n=1 Tax=Thermoflavimicrobium daqui TaxID=2137476 RepID=UPI00143D179B|nr:DUF2690 domain-containing protein [Thermoflavimicrobium daqui]